jgi:hypothetical protein
MGGLVHFRTAAWNRAAAPLIAARVARDEIVNAAENRGSVAAFAGIVRRQLNAHRAERARTSVRAIGAAELA